MKLLILACVILAAKAAKLEGYTSQVPSSGGVPLPSLINLGSTAAAGSSGQSSVNSGTHVSTSSGLAPSDTVHQSHSAQLSHVSPIVHQTGGESTINEHVSGITSGLSETCPQGQVRHVDGTCITPEIIRNVFVYAAPEQESEEISLPENIPLPKIEHNIVFIRTQDGSNGQNPIIVPPPQRKHVIYVLNKESEEGQRVIEITTPAPKNPEVYFVNYGEGETPTLPDGIDFETALNSAIHAEGQIIGGDHGLSSTDGGNTFMSGTGSGSISESGATGGSFVTGSDVNEGSIISSNEGSEIFELSASGGLITGPSNIPADTPGFNSQVPQPLTSGTGSPQNLYSTP